ncbi:MAG: GntR family transcriptional regulator [Alphaproteobacteria bacterium]|jgi:DNA-binding GntR family transcriptional regulator
MANAKKPTLKEAVYESLKGMILAGDLVAGSRLTEADLAGRLNVSRTPLREALNKLEREGLVTNKPRHGYFVTIFDLKTAEDAFDLREVLDGYAAQRATQTIGEDDKARLREIIRQCDDMASCEDRSMEDFLAEMHLGMDIHRIIAKASGNEMLYDTICSILEKFQHFVWIELLWLDKWEVTRQEHAALVEAICSGDGERAATLARRHVQGSRNNIVRFLQAKHAYHAAMARAS